MSEIIFSYNHTRCHALKVKGLLGGEVYIGEMDGFEIYIRLIRMHYSTNLDLWRYMDESFFGGSFLML